MATSGSILLLTVLMAIGLVFFLRAASKDRTTVVEVHSPRAPLEVLDGLSTWLVARGWRPESGDPERQLLRFRGQVSSSAALALLLSLLGAVGATCLGLVLRQLWPVLGWGPLLLGLLGPGAGLLYRRRAERAARARAQPALPRGDREPPARAFRGRAGACCSKSVPRALWRRPSSAHCGAAVAGRSRRPC